MTEDSINASQAQSKRTRKGDKFTGVWISADVFDSDKLSWMEKVMLGYIGSFGTGDKGCFARNTFLAEKFRTSKNSISNSISRLRKKGFIKEKLFRDGKRSLWIAEPDGGDTQIVYSQPLPEVAPTSSNCVGGIHNSMNSIIDESKGENKVQEEEDSLSNREEESQKQSFPTNSGTTPPISAAPPQAAPRRDRMRALVGKILTFLPDEFDESEEFHQALIGWAEHLKASKATMTLRGIELQAVDFQSIGLDRAIAALNNTVKKGYKGVYEPSQTKREEARGPAKPRLF